MADGISIKIFVDSWLLGSNFRRIPSLVPVLSKDATVDQLLDCELRWWNTSLIDSIFLPFDAQLIKSILVC